MKSATGIFALCSASLVGVLMLVLLGGLQDLSAATESTNLTRRPYPGSSRK